MSIAYPLIKDDQTFVLETRQGKKYECTIDGLRLNVKYEISDELDLIRQLWIKYGFELDPTPRPMRSQNKIIVNTYQQYLKKELIDKLLDMGYIITSIPDKGSASVRVELEKK